MLMYPTTWTGQHGAHTYTISQLPSKEWIVSRQKTNAPPTTKQILMLTGWESCLQPNDPKSFATFEVVAQAHKQLTQLIERDEAVHAAHCQKDSCKYGDQDCPVVSGAVQPKYPCVE